MDVMITILSSVLVFLSAIYFYLRRRHGSIENLGIPVVKPFLCFGSPPFARHKVITHEYYEQLHKKLGKTFALYSGVSPTIMTIDPEIIKEVTIKQFECFTDVFDMKVPDKMCTLDISRGEVWRNLRKIMSPTFTSGKLKTMLEPMTDVADKLLDQLKRTCGHDGAIVDVKPIYQAFSLDTIARCAFGVDTNSHLNQDNDILKYGRQIFSDFVCKDWPTSIGQHLFLLFPGILKWLNVFGDGYEKLYGVTEAIIKERDSKKIQIGDFIDRIREMSAHPPKPLNEDIIKAQGIIFFAAGFETSAHTLSTFSYNMACHPETQEKIHDEILKVMASCDNLINHETIGKMHLLEAAINENLRIFAPVTEHDRLCTKDCIVNGMHIKKNTLIRMSTWSSHHNDEFFPEPKKFEPERFLKENADQLIPLTWRPFGAGPRNCIGMRFAMTEIMIAMARILSEFRIESCPETKLEFIPGDPFLLRFEEIKVKFVPRH